ncbi:S-adenosyl-L-methionine-dependent methyltransferase [Serendipita vermifera]|nr:S-adenosyl-L-methionine-dependent methyltransferase [Serendipita vermifera]
MSNSEGSKKGNTDHLALGQPQFQTGGHTIEDNPTPTHLRNLSHGSERLRRIRFAQDPPDSSTDQSSSMGRHSHPATIYSGSIASDQMNEQGEGHNEGDGANVVSYNSARDITQFVKEVNGRIFNNVNDSYFLPSDEPEWVRLEKQSVALVITMGGLYPCPEVVEAVLNPEDGQPKHILDVGCGTGSWASEMARRFPHALVLGVDLAPPPGDTEKFPPNLQFELDDINLGLSHFYDQYDVVHARCVIGGIMNMDETIVEFQKCVKPGGVLIVMDGDHLFESRERMARLKRMPGDPDASSVSEDGSYLRRIIVEACEAGEMTGSCITRSGELIDLGLWNYPLMDPDTARSGGLYLPIGSWAKSSNTVETQMLQYGGSLMRHSFLNIHRAYHKILLQYGMSQDMLNDWSKHVDEELNGQKQKLWVRFRFCWARRRAGPDLPAPALPPRPERSSPGQSPQDSPLSENPTSVPPESEDFRRAPGHRYPAIEVFTTREEARIEREIRMTKMGELPELVVRKSWRLTQEQLAASEAGTASSRER